MHIEIHIPRPGMTFAVIGAFIAGGMWFGGAIPTAVGGTGTTTAQVVRNAEEDVRRLRLEQNVLERREEILRADLEALEQEAMYNRDPQVEMEMNETRQSLIALIQDKQGGEQEILTSLRQIWEAQGYAQLASRGSSDPNATISLLWPVAPDLGVSAFFEDAGYRRRFGMDHHAIDIPANQNTIVNAAADGVVEKVADNGMGFNSLVIRHADGFSTMYGHVSSFLVREGDRVYAGDPVALSGGRPGTPGAGKMTTGAHLHLELHKDGKQVDPLRFLPTL
jgi:murein DD-endopeptidase MepM/ murein hydrolase activator NlpD